MHHFHLVHLKIRHVLDLIDIISDPEDCRAKGNLRQNSKRFSSFFQLLLQPFLTGLCIRIAVEQDKKFIAANPVAQPVIEISIPNTVCDLDQALISLRMPVLIVDILKSSRSNTINIAS